MIAATCSIGCSKYEMLDATIPAMGYVRTGDISYGELSRQKLDVYQPTQAGPNAGVVVFFYGGGWTSGRKQDYRFVAQALSSRGFVTIIPDYRVYPEVTFPQFIEDAAMAVRWAHDNARRWGGDPQRMFLMGHSAGAHIAAMLTLDRHYLEAVGLDSHSIRATAALSGPYDFMPRPEDRPVLAMNATEKAPDAVEPIHFADGQAPPMLLVHGEEDEIVGPQNATRLAEKLRAAGAKATVIIYKSRGHAGVAMALAWPFRWLAPVLDDVTRYFDGYR